MIESNDAINAKGSNTPDQEKMLMTARTLTPKEIALDWGTTGKTLRKFLRQDKGAKGLASLAPGKGGRWAIPATSLKSAQKRFVAWKAAQALEAQKRREEAASVDSVEVPDEDEVTEEVETPESDEQDESVIDA